MSLTFRKSKISALAFTAFMVPVLGLVATYYAHRMTFQVVSSEERERFTWKSEVIRTAVQERINTVANHLMSIGSHYSVNTETKLSVFVADLGVLDHFSEIVGVGVIQRNSADTTADNSQSVRILELVTRGKSGSELVRKLMTDTDLMNTLEIAQTRGATYMSPRHQNDSPKNTSSVRFTMVSPVYPTLQAKRGIQKSRSEISKIPAEKWVFAVIDPGRLTRSAISRESLRRVVEEVDIELFEGDEPVKKYRLFDLAGGDLRTPLTEREEAFNRAMQLRLGQYIWGLFVGMRPQYLPEESRFEPKFVAAGGVIVSLLLAVISAVLIRTRSRALELAAQMSASYRQSEQRFRSLSTAAPVGIFETDSEGNLIYANSKWLEMAQQMPEQAIGKGWLNAICSEDRPSIASAWDLAVESRSTADCSFRVISDVNRVRWVHFCSLPLFGADGLTLGFVGTWEDVTIAKLSEIKAEQDLKQLMDLIRNAPVAMAFIDCKMKYVAQSAAWMNIFGEAHPDQENQSFEETCPPVFSRLRGYVKIVQKTGKVMKESEDKFTDQTGEDHYFDWAIHPVHSSDNVVSGAVVVIHRITELVQSRIAAVDAAKFKSEFLANMSHEIRTPINGVIGMTDVLMKTSLSSEQADFLGVVRKSGESLLAVVNDILDFSKIEAGKMTIESVVFDLRELVEDILDLVALGAQKKGVGIVYIMESEVPERVTGDPMRLKQILLNLVGNALKFTESGQVLVRILPGPDRTGQSLLKFEVEDTGIGISEKDSKHLFQAFTQADGSTTRKFGGTGLGLVICRKLVSLMGGEMYFDSQPGVGSTFWFTAALQRAPDSQVVNDKLRENCAGMRVLVAEFNDAQRVVLKQTLSLMNAQADTVSNLSALLQSQVFDPDNPYTHVIIDSVLLAGASRAELERLSVLVRNPAVRKILLVPLHRRDLIGEEISDLFPNQLSKPLRQAALIRSLLEITRADAADGNDGVDGIAPISLGRILLVDDNEVNRKVVGSMLSRMNLEYDLACDGREAVDKFFTAKYAVVLMDCQMPVLDGYQATAEIKSRLEGRSEAVVVAMTANAMSGERERCLAAGFDEYLSKPLRLADLESLLRQIGELGLSENDSIGNKSEDHGGAFDESAFPLVDNVYLNEFIDTCADFGADVAEENISLVRASFARSFTALGDAIANGDAEQFAAVAHRLSSSCGAVGAARLLNICRYFESFGDQAKFDGAKESLAQMLPRMQSVFDEFMIFLVKQTHIALERLKKAG